MPFQSCRRRERELVLIKGVSGSGKTCLASSTKPAVRRIGGCAIRGQCDKYQREEPYGGIAGACRELCGAIIRRKGNDDNRSQFTIMQEALLGISEEDIQLLTRIVPELSEVISSDEWASSADAEQISEESTELTTLSVKSLSKESEATKVRLQHVFRKFFQLICKHMGPLVVVLDDLQWTDVLTAEIMKALITDTDNSRILLMGLYRSDEVNGQHIRSRIREELKTMEVDEDFRMTGMTIGNLNVEQIEQILAELLSTSEKAKTTDLGEVCSRRTLGNAFFLITFIKKLKEAELLRFCQERFRWEWDVSEILSQTRASTNVIDIMKSSLQRLPLWVQRRLSIASFLGATFRASTISGVWEDLKQHLMSRVLESSDAIGEEWLKPAEKEGFIEKLRGNEKAICQWGHDRIQEASMALITSKDVADLKRGIGESLLRRLEDFELESMTFIIANLLNEGSRDASQESNSRLIEWNLQAAKKALELVAFTAATKYARKGINLLSEHSWKSDSARSLELYSIAVQTEYGCMEIEQMKLHYGIVVAQNFTVLDKLPVCFPIMNYLSGTMQNQGAVDLILKLLKDLEYTSPQSKISMGFSTVGRLLKLKRRLNRMTAEDINRLQRMTNMRDIQIMALLVKLGSYSYDLSNRLYLPLSVLGCAHLTLKKGICEHSPPAFALLSLISIGVLNDVQFGYKCGKIGQQMEDRYKFRSTAAKTSLL